MSLPRDGLRLLVVDDDPAAASTISTQLELAAGAPPVSVVHARTSGEGLARALDGAFDLLVLEHRIGAGSGLDLLRECRARGVTPPAIFLTGQGDEQVAVEALRAGATDYLVKRRLTPELLLVSIRHARERADRERLVAQT